ncbi:hypothetical protein DACRYDRAFT_24797, partial [Dacryopinax primogenitus]
MTSKPRRGAFKRGDSATSSPTAFGRLDLCGSNIIRLVGFPLDVLEGLQPVLRGDDGRGVLNVKKYTNEKGEKTAVLTLLGKPWTTDCGNVSTDILLTVICGHLHKHLFQPTTGLPPPRTTPPVHLSITFKRPVHPPSDAPRTRSVFAISFPTPTLVRTVSIPAVDEPLIFTEILGLWGGEVRDYRSLADGCYDIRLRPRRLFSSNSVGDNQTPLSALIEYLHSKGFPLIHSLHFHSKSPYPDFFLFDCPDGPVREDADPAYVNHVLTAQDGYYPDLVVEKKTKVKKERGPPTVEPKKGLFSFLRGRRSSNPNPTIAPAAVAAVTDFHSRHSLDSRPDASSFYANGVAESYM